MIPDVAYPFEYLLLAWSRAERLLHVLIYLPNTSVTTRSQGTDTTNLFLTGEVTEILAI